MPRLVKFCKPEHNLLDRCHTVRLGTPQYYRGLDPTFSISDRSEGVESFEIDSFDSANADEDATKALKEIAPLPHIQIKDINYRTTFPNCYIWCCSLADRADDNASGERFDSAYTSCYEISDSEQFGLQIATRLMSSIKRHNFNEKYQTVIEDLTIAEMRQIVVSVFQRPVEYVEEKRSKIVEGKMTGFAKDIPAPFRSIFAKSKNFEDDEEYRFVFVFSHPRYGVLSLRPEPIDLATLPINAPATLKKK